MTPFDDLDAFVALPRLSNLRLSPTGERLVVAVSGLDAQRTGYVSALWEIDPAGVRPARRLTRSAPGESTPAFTVNGELLFTSARPDPDSDSDGGNGKPAGDPKPALWVLPAQGEARAIVERPGGITEFETARADGRIVLVSPAMPGAKTADDDADARKYRKEKKVAAILHDFAPVRNWDHDLGPDRPRLFVTDIDGTGPDDLTPEPGWGYDEVSFDLAPDGRTLVTTRLEAETGGDRRSDLVAIDLTGAGTPRPRVLATDPAYDYTDPEVSPDGRFVVCARTRRPTPERHSTTTLWLIDLSTSEARDLTPSLDLWPAGPQWSPDGRTLYFHTDQDGRHPVFAVAVESGEVRRLASDAAYGDLQVSPDGTTLYALRSAIDAPPAPVRLSTDLTDQTPVFLRGPEPAPEIPGSLTEVTATAQDGTPLRAWLALPQDTSAPVPLVLWIHGGPYMSFSFWVWRWVPWLLTAQGYAVLMPDPATSTGYGDAFVARGYGRWGQEPYTDLMRITDATIARPDIDADRTAAMGGSFGGYMANWIAGHTDRFRAIISHAGLWALDQFGPTTDFAAGWFRELTVERSIENSPHLSADQIPTPMLVIHGDKDYRVPIGEALRLWTDLVTRYEGPPEEMPHRFLCFPTENHWILSPEHIQIWYRTVLAFLAWHLLGRPWEPPEHV